MTISTLRLLQIAGWGGLVVSSTGFYLQNILIDRVRQQQFYKEGLKKLRAHPGAIHYLGEPIKDKRFKMTDPTNNFQNNETAQYKIPVSGSKERGFYYIWAEKNNNDWTIVQAELELKSKKDARLAIVKK